MGLISLLKIVVSWLTRNHGLLELVAETCGLCCSGWETRSSCWYLFNSGMGGDPQFFAHLEIDYSLELRFPYLCSEKCSQILIAEEKLGKISSDAVWLDCMQYISKMGSLFHKYSFMR